MPPQQDLGGFPVRVGMDVKNLGLGVVPPHRGLGTTRLEKPPRATVHQHRVGKPVPDNRIVLRDTCAFERVQSCSPVTLVVEEQHLVLELSDPTTGLVDDVDQVVAEHGPLLDAQRCGGDVGGWVQPPLAYVVLGLGFEQHGLLGPCRRNVVVSRHRRDESAVRPVLATAEEVVDERERLSGADTHSCNSPSA